MSLRANWLTLARAVLALLFALSFRLSDVGALAWSLALLALMGLTDVLDGFFARRKGGGTRVGELIDSVADGFARLTALVVFLDARLVPAWMVLLVVWRDLFSWGLRFMDLGQGRDVVHKRLSGKVNGAVQSAAIGGTVVALLVARGLERPEPTPVIWTLMLAGAVTSVWSTVDLARAYGETLRRFVGLGRERAGAVEGRERT
ncbi:CDP-alcohol phosphatidyltransferase family protein [Deinococcus pimensis]|uniref:CDP-alcohol phosphatidyltransferase family protein n=1 Tax=Deinococcus pimensis TaxID=309888 RepID=UPI0004837320|nr:CDP-alcohol phosphatidyltransferase family protein [Deinococcus pimensis]